MQDHEAVADVYASPKMYRLYPPYPRVHRIQNDPGGRDVF